MGRGIFDDGFLYVQKVSGTRMLTVNGNARTYSKNNESIEL